MSGPERFPWILVAGCVSFFAVQRAAERALISDTLVGLGLGIAGWVALAPLFVRIGARLRKIRQRPWMIRLFAVTCVVNFLILALSVAEGFLPGLLRGTSGITALAWRWTDAAFWLQLLVLLLFVRRPAPSTGDAVRARV